MPQWPLPQDPTGSLRTRLMGNRPECTSKPITAKKIWETWQVRRFRGCHLKNYSSLFGVVFLVMSLPCCFRNWLDWGTGKPQETHAMQRNATLCVIG